MEEITELRDARASPPPSRAASHHTMSQPFAFKGSHKIYCWARPSSTEAELESAVKDKDVDAEPPSRRPRRTHLSWLHPTARLIEQRDECRRPCAIEKLEAKLAEKAELISAKDAQIAAVLEEGEQLSKRQAEQEKTIRTLKQQTREAQQSSESLAAELEETKAQLAKSTRALSERESMAAGQTAEMRAEATAAFEAREAEREAERAEYEALRVKHEALHEEHRALGVTLVQAEARDTVAAEVLREVQAENARLLEATRWRDAGLSSQVDELNARTASAEEHAQQLASSMERAIQPFRRQVNSLQKEALQYQQVISAAQRSEAALKQN